MGPRDLIEKLLSSEATKSIVFENTVKAHLNNWKWDNIHSPYFIDINTKKLRELDILSRMFYEKKVKKNTKVISDIVLLIECKSLSNYHIICDGELNKTNKPTEDNYQIWFGYDSYDRNNKVIEILNKTELNDSDKIKVINIFKEWLFPEEYSIVGDFRPPAFDNIRRFSAFRETNIGSYKDLDNSVIWKSFLSLNSACEGYNFHEWDRMESDLLSDIDYILAFKKDIIKTLKTIFYNSLLRHTSLHKILVVDSKLWSHSDNLYPLDYFRLIQRTVYGYKENWIDIVNIDFFETYLADVTKHYTDFFAEQKMKRFL